MPKSQIKNNNDSDLEFSESCQIKSPEPRRGFPMFWPDWNRLKNMADKIKSPTSLWQVLGPAFFGIALSALIGGLTILEKDHPNKTLCYWLFLLFLIMGIFSLLIQRKHKEVSNFSKEQLIDEMNKLEKPYKENEDNSV
ncbi:hypothetical protein KKH39_01570 [Patescibacteria group bacterium]|nr:hypothetical protein [Patescibacteria group bacterium]